MTDNPMRRKPVTASDQLPGRIAMTVGRALDPIVQYGLLRRGIAKHILTAIGIKRVMGLPLVTRIGLNTDFFGPGLVDKPGNLLLAMSAITALRHIYWANVECHSQFPVSAGLGVSLLNCVLNSINSLVFVYRVSKGRTNPLASGWMQYLGFAFVLAGSLGEIVAENARRNFKNDSRNAGKVYQGGAFGVVRNANYSYYTLWRVGFALASGSWVNTATQFLASFALFSVNSIPEKESYMAKKYGADWTVYTKRVPYKFLPYIY